MRALVTGCAGFIGSHLVESLLFDGQDVLGVDCFNDNYGRKQKLGNLARAMDWERFEFVPIDLARGELTELTQECDVIFHLAAEPGVRASWGDRFEQYVRNNVQATQQLLEATKSTPDKRFVLASSSSVYGQAERSPTPEDITPRPFSPYGVTKLSAEHLCGLYHANYGVAAVSLRLFSVYGPRQRPDMAFNRFCQGVLTGEPITIFGDGSQTRDFTYIDDVVRAFRLAADTPGIEGRVLNVGGGARVTLNVALRLLAEVIGRGVEIRYEPPRHGDVHDTCADTTQVRDALSFVPRTDLSEGLAAEIDWVRDTLESTQATPTRRPR
jgi:UDP-glucuronate 4-epimerase